MDSGTGGTLLVFGTAPNFGLNQGWPGKLNAALSPDAALLASWQNWFNLLWHRSPPLSPATMDIPHLVLPEGDPRAGEAWEEYRRHCNATPDDPQTGSRQIEVDPETGKVTLKDASGQPVSAVDEELGLPKVDALEQQVARLFQAGELVTVDKSSRIPPLRAPIRAEWFGVERFRKVGSVSRELKYYISLLDGETLRQLEGRRKMTNAILDTFSFSMGEGMHWMPLAARPLFEKEMDRVDQEGLKILTGAVGGNLDEFTKTRLQQVMQDINTMYREFHGTHTELTLPHDTLEKILEDLKSQLQRAIDEKRLLPKVSPITAGFKAGADSGRYTAWAQALSLLSAIARFPRKAFSDGYFLRGLRVDKDELLEAMNVCDDAIVAAWQEQGEWRIRARAEAELELLDRIAAAGCPARTKCQAVLQLMRGEPLETIERTDEQSARHQNPPGSQVVSPEVV